MKHKFEPSNWEQYGLHGNDTCEDCQLSRGYCSAFQVFDCPAITQVKSATDVLESMQKELEKLWKIRDIRYETLGRYATNNLILSGAFGFTTEYRNLHSEAQKAVADVKEQENAIEAVKKFL
jgi:hypothetical protein